MFSRNLYYYYFYYCKGSSIKDVRTKSRKVDLSFPLVCKMSALAQPLCPCGHTMNFEKSEFFCTKKCERLHLKNLLSP